MNGSSARQRHMTIWWRLVSFGFRLLYNEMAWTYDAVSWVVSLGQWRQWQRAALAYVNGRDLLEIAHGPGHLLLELAQQGYQITGYDLSPWMGRLARRRLQRAGLVANLVRGRAEALPFAAGSFDTVLSTFPTEFVIRPDTLTAVYRVLRANGRFVIVPSAVLTGRSPLHRFLEWLYRITGQRQGGDSEATAVQEPWIDYQQRFENAGFTLEVHTVTIPGSRITVVVATRRESEEGAGRTHI
jgi:ubiquinone/menaquinone biosynthesis C-methylase UbiE